MTTLTKDLLVELIEEVLQELACHRPDGKWGPCKKGNVLSVLDTNTRVKDPNIKGHRGTITGKKKDGSYRLASRFGENGKDPKKSSGRKTMSGEDISPTKYVGSRYPKQYYTEQVLEEQWTALQHWLSKQDGSNKEEEVIEESDCDCSKERKKAYLQGQKAILYWIQQWVRLGFWKSPEG